MLKIIGAEVIAALAALIAYEIICIKEKWETVQSEKQWRKRMESRMSKWSDKCDSETMKERLKNDR